MFGVRRKMPQSNFKEYDMFRFNKKWPVLLAAVFMMGTSAFASGTPQTAQFSGSAGSQQIGLDDVDVLSLDQLGSVRIENGETASVVFSGPEENLGSVSWNYEEGYLRIEGVGNEASSVNAVITVPDFDGLIVSGGTRAVLAERSLAHGLALYIEDGGIFSTEGVLTVENLEVYARGAESGSLEVNAGALDVKTDGGRLVFSGSAGEMKLYAMRASDVELNGLNLDKGEVTLNDTSALTGSLAGLSNLTILGRQNSQAEVALNGRLKAGAYDDAVLKFEGDIRLERNYTEDDAKITVK